MGWRVQMAMKGDVLDRIVWLLLALADLAECAAGASEARRRMLLSILRPGETAARDAFATPPPDAAVSAMPAAPIALSGDRPEDAIALAMSLRALALIVRALASPRRRLSSLLAGETRPRSVFHPACRARVQRFAAAAFPPAQRLDTS